MGKLSLKPTFHLSVALAAMIGYPLGWSLCGILGMVALVKPWSCSAISLWGCLVDGDPDHCLKAVHRSIARVQVWN